MCLSMSPSAKIIEITLEKSFRFIKLGWPMQGIHSEEAVKISLLLENPNATHISPPLALHQCFVCLLLSGRCEA